MMEEREAATRVLQAHMRGLLVRRRFRRVLQEYVAVVQDIEGEEIAVHPGKWLLSNPQSIPLDGVQAKQPSESKHYGYPHSMLTRSAEDFSEFQHREAPASVICRGSGCLQVKNTQIKMSWIAKENDVQSPERERCLAETVGSERERCLAETVGLERERCLAETVGPERERCLTETVGPERERCLAQTVGPERERCLAQTVGPERERCLAESVGPEWEPCLHHSDIVMSTDHSLEWRRDSSLWSDKLLDTEISLKNMKELRKHKSHLAMEILWVQQAIASRKNYLMVRHKLRIRD